MTSLDSNKNDTLAHVNPHLKIVSGIIKICSTTLNIKMIQNYHKNEAITPHRKRSRFLMFLEILCILDYIYHQIKKLKSCPRGRRNWAPTVLFVFCALESKFKDIPSKRQNYHCELIFRLDWFPQSWGYMFKSIAIKHAMST